MSDISRLKIRGTEYTLKDAVARGEETETDNSVSSIRVDGKVYDVKDLAARGEGEPAAREISKVSVGGTVYQIKDATARKSGYAYYFAVFSYDDGSLTFYGDNELPEKEYRDKDVSELYEDVENTDTPPWESMGNNIKSVMFDESFAGARPKSCHEWFMGFNQIATIDGLTNLNTSSVTDMSNMFSDCSSLTTLDVSGLNTSSVTDMSNMFSNCMSLTTLDVSGWDTSSVTDMGYMFSNCNRLTTIYSNDDKFVTTKVTSDTDMFYGCSSLRGGNGTRFDSAKVTSDMAHVDTADNPGYFTGK